MVKDSFEDECKIELIHWQTGTTERPGGQQAGMPATLVRVTHLPTKIMAQFGGERSLHRNKQVALEMLEWGLLKAGELGVI